jgi:hypothetical protein
MIILNTRLMRPTKYPVLQVFLPLIYYCFNFVNTEASGRDFLELGPDDLDELFKKNHVVFGGLLGVTDHLFDGIQVPEEFHVFVKLHQNYTALTVWDALPLTSNRLVYRRSQVICRCFLDHCIGYRR